MKGIQTVPLRDQVMNPLLVAPQWETKDQKTERKRIKKEEQQAETARQTRILNLVENHSRASNEYWHGMWQEARSFNGGNIRLQQAMSPIMSLKNETSISTIDIETLGTPSHLRGKGVPNLFDITEIALVGSTFKSKGNEFVQTGKNASILVKPRQETIDFLTQTLNDLQQNIDMGMDEAVKRSVLDLVKYSDDSFISPMEYNGVKYMGISGHAEAPSANTILTKNMLTRARRGLNNLKKGTAGADVLNMMKGAYQANGGIYMGHNIFNFDLPALSEFSRLHGNQGMSDYFTKHASNAIDTLQLARAVVDRRVAELGPTLELSSIAKTLQERNLIPKRIGTAHFALDDTMSNTDIAGYIVGKARGVLGKNNTLNVNFPGGRINKKLLANLAKNKVLFSHTSSKVDETKHAGFVVAREGKDGKLNPMYNGLNSPLPSHESFTLGDSFYMDDNGTMKPGVKLHSSDTKGKVIVMTANTVEELQEEIHKRFSPMNKKEAKMKRAEYLTKKARTKYDELFTDMFGFSNMKEMYSILNEAGTKPKDVEKYLNKFGGDYPKTSLVDTMQYLAPLLREEEKIWGQVIAKLDKDKTLSEGQKTAILHEVKKKIDVKGKNVVEIEREVAAALSLRNFNFSDGTSMLFNAEKIGEIESTFLRYINGGNNELKDGSRSAKANRATKLFDEIIANFGLSGDEEDLEEMKRNLVKGIYEKENVYGETREVAKFVQEQMRGQSPLHVSREVTNVVSNERVAAITEVHDELQGILKGARRKVKQTHKKKDLPKELRDFLSTQDKRIKGLVEKQYGYKGVAKTGQAIQDAVGDMSLYEQKVTAIVNRYSQAFDVQIQFGKNGDGTGRPFLVLSEKGKVNTAQDLTQRDSLAKQGMAVIELPSLNEDLTVNWRNQKKMPIMRIGQYGNVNHKLNVVDGLDEILNYFNRAEDLLANPFGPQNMLDEIRRGVMNAIDRQVDPSKSHFFQGFDTDDFTARSQGDIKMGGYVDVSDLGKVWYERNRKRLGARLTTAEVEEEAKKRGVSFLDALSENHRAIAQLHIDDIAYELTGIRTSMGGVGPKHSQAGLRRTAAGDQRNLMAFGNLSGDSRESTLKVARYIGLREDEVREATNDKKWRYVNSTVSQDALELTDIRGITSITAHMADSEIAAKLNDKAFVEKAFGIIDQKLKNKEITEADAKHFKAALSVKGLAATEGMAFMSDHLFKAFTKEEFMNSYIGSDDFKLNDVFEDIFSTHSEKIYGDSQAWRQRGIYFEGGLTLTDEQKNALIQNKKMTVGSYTRNGIRESVVEVDRFHQSEELKLYGFSLDFDNGKNGVVLSRKERAQSGHKYVTESAVRGTMVRMPSEIIEMIAGEKVDFVSQAPSAKKGLNDVASLIRGFESRIRMEFDGDIPKSSYSKGYANVEDALSNYVKEVNAAFSFNALTLQDGRIVENGKITKDLTVDQRNRFSSAWQSKLGLNREVHGEIVMSHDVFSRFGIKDARITKKEIDYITEAFYRAGIDRPDGKESQYIRHLRGSAFFNPTNAEVERQRVRYAELSNVMGRGFNADPQQGDVVVDYTADGMRTLGEVNAKVEDGIVHVAKDTFSPMPDRSRNGGFTTVGDYMNTIVAAGNKELVFEAGGSGKQISQQLKQGDGVMYMKLPDFAGREYLPLIDTNTMARVAGLDEDRIDFLSDYQSKYASLVANLEQYAKIQITDGFDEVDVENTREHLQKRIRGNVEEIEGLFAKVTSAKGSQAVTSDVLKGSVYMKTAGVNPMAAYYKKDGKWQLRGSMNMDEATDLVNGERLRHVLSENEKIQEGILRSWGMDIHNVENPLDYIIENANEKGIYNRTVRHPAINAGVQQIGRLQVSDAVSDDTTATGLGKKIAMNKDYDGDQSVMDLSHYGVDYMENSKEEVLKEKQERLTELKSKMLEIESSEAERVAKRKKRYLTIADKVRGDIDALKDKVFEYSERAKAEGVLARQEEKLTKVKEMQGKLKEPVIREGKLQATKERLNLVGERIAKEENALIKMHEALGVEYTGNEADFRSVLDQERARLSDIDGGMADLQHERQRVATLLKEQTGVDFTPGGDLKEQLRKARATAVEDVLDDDGNTMYDNKNNAIRQTNNKKLEAINSTINQLLDTDKHITNLQSEGGAIHKKLKRVAQIESKTTRSTLALLHGKGVDVDAIAGNKFEQVKLLKELMPSFSEDVAVEEAKVSSVRERLTSKYETRSNALQEKVDYIQGHIDHINSTIDDLPTENEKVLGWIEEKNLFLKELETKNAEEIEANITQKKTRGISREIKREEGEIERLHNTENVFTKADFTAMQSELKEAYLYSKEANEVRASMEMDKVYSGITGEMVKGGGYSIEDARGMVDTFFSDSFDTVGSHERERITNAITEAANRMDQSSDWGSIQMGMEVDENGEHPGILKALQDTKTARIQNAYIGSADNLRKRISDGYKSVMFSGLEAQRRAGKSIGIQEEAVKYSTAVVEEFIREFSQKGISSKKSQGIANAEDMINEFADVIKKVRDGKPSERAELVQTLVNRGLFSDADTKGIFIDHKASGFKYNKGVASFISEALNYIEDGENLLKGLGYDGYRDSIFKMFTSQGVNEREFAKVIATNRVLPFSTTNDIMERYATNKARLQELNDAFIERVGTMFKGRLENAENEISYTMNADNTNINRTRTRLEAPEGTPRRNSFVGDIDVDIPNDVNTRTIQTGIQQSSDGIFSMLKSVISNNKSIFGGLAIAGGALGAMNLVAKGAPTPEGMEKSKPVPQQKMTGPSARVTQNDGAEYINIKVNAANAKNMSPSDIAALVNNEVMAMAGTKMNTNVMIQDNSSNVNSQWLQGVVANSMDKGYAF